ncbi:MAG TPA: very short patch repair endonuclease [Thermoanaerobaculia bacterium]|nr:very short patch repair endonuclease [Thermoanaerobaculia bacterium]
MTDHLSKAERSRLMSRIHSDDTTPELYVRRILHSAGVRYRLHCPELPGKPDLVIARLRFAVFVNGCFWHQHGCGRSFQPATNTAYWTIKFARTRSRGEQTRILLEAQGWKVHVLWECQLDTDVEGLLREIRHVSSDLCHSVS